MRRPKVQKIFLLILVCSFSFILCGCIKPKYLINNYDPPRTIAVLPVDNQTTDLVGGQFIRHLFHQYVTSKGYQVIDLSYIDDNLNEAGITDGGQLSSMTPQQIGRLVGAEGVVYGTLTEFKFVNIGFYIERKVAANFRLFSSRSGELLWEDERQESKTDVALSLQAAGETMLSGLGAKLVEGIFRSPLGNESNKVVKTIISTLPKCAN